MRLRELLARVPDGWSEAAHSGRRYAVTKAAHAGGRAISVYAEELRPCEMPAAKVIAFLQGATFATGSEMH